MGHVSENMSDKDVVQKKKRKVSEKERNENVRKMGVK